MFSLLASLNEGEKNLEMHYFRSRSWKQAVYLRPAIGVEKCAHSGPFRGGNRRPLTRGVGPNKAPHAWLSPQVGFRVSSTPQYLCLLRLLVKARQPNKEERNRQGQEGDRQCRPIKAPVDVWEKTQRATFRCTVSRKVTGFRSTFDLYSLTQFACYCFNVCWTPKRLQLKLSAVSPFQYTDLARVGRKKNYKAGNRSQWMWVSFEEDIK